MPEDYNYIKDEPVILPEIEKPTAEAKQPHKFTPKSLLLLLAAFVSGAILTAAGFLLFAQPSSDSAPNDQTATTDLPHDSTDEDLLKTYDEEILRADEDDQFIIKLDKASRLVSLERHNEALAVLSSISKDGLNDDQLYRLYSTYLFLYDAIGDEAEIANYTALFNEVYARLDAEGRFAEVKKAEVAE